MQLLGSLPLTCQTYNLKMDKLQLTGQNLDRTFNFKSGCVHPMHFCWFESKWPYLKLKTRPAQLKGSLLLTCQTDNLNMDKLQLTRQNLCRVFNFKSAWEHPTRFCCYESKWPNLKLKTRPKQLSGSLPLHNTLLASNKGNTYLAPKV